MRTSVLCSCPDGACVHTTPRGRHKRHARRTVRSFDTDAGTYGDLIRAACRCGWEATRWTGSKQVASAQFAAHLDKVAAPVTATTLDRIAHDLARPDADCVPLASRVVASAQNVGLPATAIVVEVTATRPDGTTETLTPPAAGEIRTDPNYGHPYWGGHAVALVTADRRTWLVDVTADQFLADRDPDRPHLSVWDDRPGQATPVVVPIPRGWRHGGQTLTHVRPDGLCLDYVAHPDAPMPASAPAGGDS